LSKIADAYFSITVVNHSVQLTTTDVHVGIDRRGTSLKKNYST